MFLSFIQNWMHDHLPKPFFKLIVYFHFIRIVCFSWTIVFFVLNGTKGNVSLYVSRSRRILIENRLLTHWMIAEQQLNNCTNSQQGSPLLSTLSSHYYFWALRPQKYLWFYHLSYLWWFSCLGTPARRHLKLSFLYLWSILSMLAIVVL